LLGKERASVVEKLFGGYRSLSCVWILRLRYASLRMTRGLRVRGGILRSFAKALRMTDRKVCSG